MCLFFLATNMLLMGSTESSEKVCMKQYDLCSIKLTVECILTFDFGLASCPPEGVRKLFSGATMASSRGALVTVGQVIHADDWLIVVHT